MAEELNKSSLNDILSEARETPDEFNKYYNYVEEKIDELMGFLKENFKGDNDEN